jgi:hypothetical protein
MFALGHYHPRPRVLVIGLGGGPDVQCALYHGASSIDVAEINPDSIAAVTGPFDRWLGGIGSDRRVRYHVYDGRSFAHAARGRGYDLVQLSGVDTKAALASGSLALSENQLYTQEAFVDYLSSLSDRGVLAILRFEEWEALRLANTAADALRTLGVTRPDRHVAIVRNGPLFGVLVQRSPFTLDDSQALYARFPAADPAFRGVFIWFYEIFDYPLRKRPEVVHTPFAPAQGPIGGYFAALASGREAQFIQEYPLQISATHDDRPFFFDVMRYDQPQTWQAPHMRLLRNMLGTVSFLSIALILLPVWRMRMRKTAELLRALGFFGTIGLGYLLIEVWLLHRFGMFLGHQTRALVVVLSGLLVSSGVGASVGERLWPEPRGRVLRAMLAIAAWLVLGAFALPGLFDTELAASLVGRVLLTLAFVLPLGFAMGMPFPAGLRWARGVDALSVPWCVGVNAFSSVLATVAVVPMAMVWGYAAVALAGTVLYGLAALLALSWQSAASTPS